MSNFDALKEVIASNIKTNGSQEITGQTLQSVLITIVSTLGADAAFGGVAVPSTNPGTPDKPLFYVASTEGTYTYFDSAVVNKGEIAFFSNASGTWECEKITLPAGQSYTHPAGNAASKSLGLYKISTDSTSHVKSVSAVTKSDITGLGIPEKDTTYNNATQSTAGLMSAADKAKLDSLNVDDVINVLADARALKGATMRFDGFVSGVTVSQVGVAEWDGIVYDTAKNKFLAKKNNGTLSPTYYSAWTGMDAYMSDELGTSILKDRLYLYGEDVYVWSDTEGTLVKVDKETSNATQDSAGLMSAEDKAKLDNAFSRKALQKAELTDLSSTNNWFASSINADGNLQIEKKGGLAYTAICKVDTTALETGKAYRAVVIYKSPDSSFILSNGEVPSQMQTECPKSEDWNQIEFEFLNFYGYITFQGLANVFPQYSIVTFKSIEFYPYGRVSADLLDLADEVDTIKNDISAEDWQDITPLCAVRRYENVTVGSALPSATNGGNHWCAELDVKEGEKYKLTTYSSYNKYPLIFVDKDNIVIKYVTAYQSRNITEYDGTGFEFSIPRDCVKIIVHYDYSNTGVTFKLMKASRFYIESINNKYKDANKYLWERLYPFSEDGNYGNVLCGEIGTFIKKSGSRARCTDIIPCSEGDVFHIRTYPSLSSCAKYMFFDNNNRCIEGEGNITVYPAPSRLFDDYVVAPKNATKLVVNGLYDVTNYTGEEDSISDIFVIKCVKKSEPVILRNTEAIGAITSATKKFVKNNTLIKQWDGYFCIAHISDVHADPVRYRRFRTFVDNVYSINTAISTGDLVSFHNNDTTKMQIEYERMFAISGEKDVMIVVGNHEKVGAGNTLYTEQQIKDYSGLENLYYYKDWTKTGDLAYKVRVIVLNQHDYDGADIKIAGRTHYSQAQINWFINTLKEASTDNRAVIVAMHKTDKFIQPTNNDYGFNCNFPSDSDTNQSGYIIEDIIDAFKNGTHLTGSYTWADNSQTIDVDADFGSKEGSFIAYMCGHNHRDQVGYSPQHPNQLYLCIASGCLQQMYATYGKGNYGEQVSDLSRVIGTKSEDCFNVYGIDFDNKTVRIVRVGADVTCNMKNRKYLELSWSPS